MISTPGPKLKVWKPRDGRMTTRGGPPKVRQTANPYSGHLSYPTSILGIFQDPLGKGPKTTKYKTLKGYRLFVSIFRPLPTISIQFQCFNIDDYEYMLFPFASWETSCNLPQALNRASPFFCLGFRPRSLGDPVRALAVEGWFFSIVWDKQLMLELATCFFERRSRSRPEFLWWIFVEIA